MNLNRALRECEDLHGCVFSGVSNDCNDPAAWIEAFGKYERQILRLQERNLTDVLFEKAAKIAYGCPAAMVRILEVWPDAGSENKAGSSALQACERLYCKAAETLLGMARDSRIGVDTSEFLDALKCVHRFCRETKPETALNVLSRHVLFRPRLAGASRGGKPPERMPASGRETVDAMATVNRAIAGIDPERSLQPDIARLAEQAGDLIDVLGAARRNLAEAVGAVDPGQRERVVADAIEYIRLYPAVLSRAGIRDWRFREHGIFREAKTIADAHLEDCGGLLARLAGSAGLDPVPFSSAFETLTEAFAPAAGLDGRTASGLEYPDFERDPESGGSDGSVFQDEDFWTARLPRDRRQVDASLLDRLDALRVALGAMEQLVPSVGTDARLLDEIRRMAEEWRILRKSPDQRSPDENFRIAFWRLKQQGNTDKAAFRSLAELALEQARQDKPPEGTFLSPRMIAGIRRDESAEGFNREAFIQSYAEAMRKRRARILQGRPDACFRDG